jgi:DNA-binding transcriptional MerR regulator
MPKSMKNELGLRDLSQRSGVPARTIRYYIARGLLPQPLKGGRGATYGEIHLERIARIQVLKAEGLTLAEIRMRLEGMTQKGVFPLPVNWISYSLAEDVVIFVQRDVSPWRLRKIRQAMEELARRLEE